jgi:hypothetical protein
MRGPPKKNLVESEIPRACLRKGRFNAKDAEVHREGRVEENILHSLHLNFFSLNHQALLLRVRFQPEGG